MRSLRAFTLAAILYTLPVHADSYLGLAAGNGVITNYSGFNASIPSKIYFGKQYGMGLAMEIGMTNLGRFDLSGFPPGYYYTTTGLEISALVKFGQGRLHGMARLGFYTSGNHVYVSDTLTTSDLATSATYGLGASYDITDHLELVAEYQLYPAIVDIDFAVTTIGINYHF